MADIKDSPISQLSAATALSAPDLLLVSKEYEAEGKSSYTSNSITFSNMVSSTVDYMTGPLSAYLSSHISSFTGTVTLKEWTYVPPNE